MFTGKVCRLLQITKLTLNNCQREGNVKGLNFLMDIVMHCFTIKMYSKRKRKVIQELIKEV